VFLYKVFSVLVLLVSLASLAIVYEPTKDVDTEYQRFAIAAAAAAAAAAGR
jgi:hypothetical protein